MSYIPFSHRRERLIAWTKAPLPATQAAAFLLLLSAGATAAWLPPQARTRLVQPLAYFRQATVQLVQSAGIPFIAPQSGATSVAATGSDSEGAPRVLLASAPAQTKAIRPRAVTLTVNSTGDADDATPGDGICQTPSAQGAVCTLRAAITESNASNGGTINFNISGSGVKTISPATQLPNILVPVNINGYSQPGSSANMLSVGDNAKILIELNSANVNGAGAGLLLNVGSNGSVISGLAVNNVSAGSGIAINSNSNTVRGCFLGTDASGTIGRGNSFNGVFVVGASGNTIGGPAPADRNVISDNGNGNNGSRPGVLLIQNVTNNTVQNNYVGTDLTGTQALGNGGSGIQLFSQSTDTSNSTGNVIVGNLVSGNGGGGGFDGIDINGIKTSTTTVQGNKVGTNATGTAALPNTGAGIQLVSSSNNTIGGTGSGQGNLISGNATLGLILNSSSNSNTIQGNLIGTNAAGTAALGNGTNGLAIVNSGANTVGGTTSGARNVVSGNGIQGSLPGILINMKPTSQLPNTVAGNFVGTDITGTKDLGNGGSGIQVFSTSSDAVTTNGTQITGNLLSGNGTYGADIDGPKTNDTHITSNKVGTDVTGTKAIPNSLAGIQVLNAQGVAIGAQGGQDASFGNLISGNGSAGIAFSTGSDFSFAARNLIGTDVTGLKPLSNGLIGIGINNAKGIGISNNTITSATSSGIFVGGSLSTFTQITQNKIGVGVDGTTPLGNGGDGILFSGAAPSHSVGDSLSEPGDAHTRAIIVTSGLGNIIANNSGAGVSIKLATVTQCHRKSILGNSIYNNGGLGIDLNGDGVTANQPSSNQGDSTVGPNALQNYPILSPVTKSGGNVTITGTLTSAKNANFLIQFFSSPTADPSGFGEGKTFLGNKEITTSATGTVNFTATFPAPASDTKFSATATDSVGNTSEFSSTATGPTTGPTSTPRPGPTSTPQPTATPRPGPTSTPQPTATPRPGPTLTPQPTATSQPGPSPTPKVTSTPGPTATPGATATPTPRPTATATPRPTSTPRPTATPAPTATPSPGLSINDVSITEGNSGTKNATFTVTLSGNLTNSVSVNYATSNGTATAGSDYTATSGTLNFSVNTQRATRQTTSPLSQTISVAVRGDTTREADETFFVNLSGASGAAISRGQGTGTILNDDSVADLSVTQTASASSVTTGSLATFTLTIRNNGPDTAQNVTVSDVLPPGSTFVSSTPVATSQSGSTLTFALGTLASGATRTVLVQVRAPSSAGTLQNSASVAGTGAVDPSPPNNGSSASVAVTTGAPAFSFTLGRLINVGPYSPTLYRPGGHFIQDVTVTNAGTAPSSSPLLLVLDGLPSSVTLVGATGSDAGSPYITLPGPLNVGQSTTVRLEFRLSRSDRPAFTPRIIDGIQPL
ncbi:hypothetical protein IAD21_05731 [Abditibacteriota bacterium]|nr:hypothetical protein IAD21_05731 [Abditibacteriota bacterium]